MQQQQQQNAGLAGLGQFAGTVLQAYTSSRESKHVGKRVDGKKALKRLEDADVMHWKYRNGKGDGKAHSDFAQAGVVSKLITLGCVAQRLHTSLKYDIAADRFANNEVANRFLALPPRKGWEAFYRI